MKNKQTSTTQLTRAVLKRLGGAKELDRFSRAGWLTVVEALKLSGLSDRHFRRLVREAEGDDAIRHRTDIDVLRIWFDDVPIRPAKVDPDSIDLSAPE